MARLLAPALLIGCLGAVPALAQTKAAPRAQPRALPKAAVAKPRTGTKPGAPQPARPALPGPRLAPGDGFRGAYHRGAFREPLLQRTDPVLDFDWQQAAPAPGVPADSFSVRWTTYVQVPATGQYTLLARFDGSIRVWLGGRPMIEDWNAGDRRTATAKVRLTGGKVYDVRVDYLRAGGSGRVYLAWQRPNAGQPVAIGTRYLHQMLPLTVEPEILPARDVLLTTLRPTRPRVVPPPPPTLAALGQLAKGTVVELQNLYFEQGKARLLPTSGPTVDELTTALKANPAVKLEIGGHTDNVGDSLRNQRLSEQRARHIRGLLITRGIDSVRLSAVGYGSRRPVADNADPAQRPRNRRVEITVR